MHKFPSYLLSINELSLRDLSPLSQSRYEHMSNCGYTIEKLIDEKKLNRKCDRRNYKNSQYFIIMNATITYN